MTIDDGLRRLERALGTGAGTEQRMQYARALLRAGRLDDAVAAISPARADPTAWRHVGAFPTWSVPDADEGASRFVDVPVIRGSPRELWVRRPQGRGRPLEILAAALGLVILRENHPPLVCDPDTGRPCLPPVRADSVTWSRYAPCAVLVGSELIVATGRRIVSCDLATNQVTFERVLPRAPAWKNVRPLLRPSEVVLLDRTGVVVSLSVPSFEPRWEAAVPPAGELSPALLGTKSLVLTESRGRLRAFERRAGALRWSRSDETTCLNVRADDRGVVIRERTRRRESEVVLGLDDDGRTIWRSQGRPGYVAALAPDFAVLCEHLSRPFRLVAIDRRTGARRVLAELAARELGADVTLVRDAVLLKTWTGRDSSAERVAAVTPEGQLLWTHHPRVPVEHLVPYARRIYLLHWDGSVSCLGDEAGAARDG